MILGAFALITLVLVFVTLSMVMIVYTDLHLLEVRQKAANKILTDILKALLPVERPAESISFFTTINGHSEGVTEMFLQQNKRLPLKIQILDAKRNPAKVDGLPVWALSDDTIGGITPSEDGLSAVFVPSGKVGSVQIQVKADADLGEGKKEIVGSLDVEVMAGEAVFLELSAGEPEDQTSPAPQEPVEPEPSVRDSQPEETAKKAAAKKSKK